MKELTKEEAATLRRELTKRARALSRQNESCDPAFFYANTPACQVSSHKPWYRKPEVKRLDHYMETICSTPRKLPCLCICTFKDGRTVIHRHRKGRCPHMVYLQKGK